MTWLVQEIWLWMALAALAGAVLTGFFSTTEVKTERWVPTPVPEEPTADETPATASAPVAPTEEQGVFTSPFPEFQTTSGPRPWEEEELWSRPTEGAAAPSTPFVPESADAPVADTEWDADVDSWRGWADEETWSTSTAETYGDLQPVDEPTGTESIEAELEDEPEAPVEAAADVELETDEEVPAPVEATTGDDAESPVESEGEVEGEDAAAAETTPAEESPAPVEELSAAEKIRAELARLEAELEKREQRKRELLEAERLHNEALAAEQPVQVDSALEPEPAAPARKPRKRATEKAPEVAPEQAEAERLEAERLEAERAARAKARAERAAATRARRQAEKAEAERLERERQAAEAEKARLKAERAAAARERARAKRAEAARLKAEQEAAERAEQERAEAERAEAEHLTAEQVEQAESLEEALTAHEPATSGPTWLDPEDDSDAWKQGPFGVGSAYAAFDGSAPRGYTIKANLTTRLYHSRKSRFYSRTQADVWFETEEHAEAAGFTRWDQRGTMAHAAVHGEPAKEGPAA